MFNFTIFGGSEVKLDSGSKLILTMFGGTDVFKSTLAKRIMQEKHLLESERGAAKQASDWAGNAAPAMSAFATMSTARSRRRQRTFILTIFGGVEIKPPSLAEEFMDMRELTSSGLISSEEWDALVGRLYQLDDLEGISSFTLFGGLEHGSLSEADELKKIKSARDLGLLGEEEEVALRSVAGRDPQQVRMLLRQTAFARPA